ncbi:DUF5668 domain-containing protein [SCandidatus Aminicenantes bacterium Aminicenantia_JdfR_composite]|jgi:hypothetical protein|nr:DUF5668 domain-containing protein [SCandidatus Aminicenantes bacterium Aminicenantia_JdfR_composite]MCP2598631.1 DUF5668 domain-containing protein [Candidatus Aminicenantes bacterium AC-335-L06]
MKKEKREKLFWGIVLIIIGIIFLLHNLNISFWENLFDLWPLILIGWGIWKIYLGVIERVEKAK